MTEKNTKLGFKEIPGIYSRHRKLLMCGLVNISGKKDEAEREKYILWLYDLEYRVFGLPKPTVFTADYSDIRHFYVQFLT